MRESLKVVLESHGYQADMVESAEEGLESLSNNDSLSQYDLITILFSKEIIVADFEKNTSSRIVWPSIKCSNNANIAADSLLTL